jgi:hypothetical protein
VTVSLGVAMESDSFFMGCYGKWQFLKGLLWKVTVSLGVAMESDSFVMAYYGSDSLVRGFYRK